MLVNLLGDVATEVPCARFNQETHLFIFDQITELDLAQADNRQSGTLHSYSIRRSWRKHKFDTQGVAISDDTSFCVCLNSAFLLFIHCPSLFSTMNV